ncbi:MAG: hypothetical protein SFU25_11635 [Candidatus Caenarcaniphilales bacterium]|nr:hypothetical protein [Candidatus Caenarcaniphilales bacterium]
MISYSNANSLNISSNSISYLPFPMVDYRNAYLGNQNNYFNHCNNGPFQRRHDDYAYSPMDSINSGSGYEYGYGYGSGLDYSNYFPNHSSYNTNNSKSANCGCEKQQAKQTSVEVDITYNKTPNNHNPNENEQNYLFLEDLHKGGDKDFDDTIFRTKGLIKEAAGIFRVAGNGKVEADYLLDRGSYKGEVAAFSLKGMEYLDKNSDQFKREAVRRAKSNSKEGRVIVSDVRTKARFDGGNGGEKNFEFNAGEKVGLIYLGNSSFDQIDPNGQWPMEVYFSTGSSDHFDHFKISKQPEHLSDDAKVGEKQLKDSLASAQGVLA